MHSKFIYSSQIDVIDQHIHSFLKIGTSLHIDDKMKCVSERVGKYSAVFGVVCFTDN